MTKFFCKLKKNYFWSFVAHFPNFWHKKCFSMKSSWYAQFLKDSWHHAKIKRNLMIQSQENTQMDVRRQGWTDPIS